MQVFDEAGVYEELLAVLKEYSGHSGDLTEHTKIVIKVGLILIGCDNSSLIVSSVCATSQSILIQYDHIPYRCSIGVGRPLQSNEVRQL
jgi:hypothetical protein